MGAGLTLIQNFYILVLGRIIYGFCAGSVSTIGVRMIVESVPPTWLSACMGLWTAMQNLGAFIPLLFGLILPKDNDTEALEQN